MFKKDKMPSARGQKRKKVHGGGTFSAKNLGFSLVELIVIIAILAVFIAILAPSLMQYTENSRAQKDVSAMDEVVNAVQLAMADQNCYDEMLHYSIDNNYITYTDSSGEYGAIIADGEYWAPDGSGRATTITFNPEEGPMGKTQYRLDKAIINDMTYGNGSVAQDRVISGAQLQDVQCYFKNASLNGNQTGYTYNQVRQSIGDDLITTSQTYRNSSFTIFIIFTQKDNITVADVNGSFNGTNLYIGAPASKGSGTDDYIVDINTGTITPNGNDSGMQQSNYTASDLSGDGNFGGGNIVIKDYMSDGDAKVATTGTLDTFKLGDFIYSNISHVDTVIFTTVPTLNGTDVSYEQNNGVLAWRENNICYVASAKTGCKVMAPQSMQLAFGGHTRHNGVYQYIKQIDVSALHVSKATTNLHECFYVFGSLIENQDVSITGLEYWDVSNVSNFSHTFCGVGKNTTKNVKIDNINNWNISSATSLNSCFRQIGQKANNINIGNVSSWDTSKATDLSYMFSGFGMRSATFNIGNLSNWDVSNVTNMTAMFYDCGRNATVWDIGNLSNWNTSKVTTMQTMFGYAADKAKSVNLNLSNWDTANVTNMTNMFNHFAPNAKTWYVGNLSQWDVGNVTEMRSMFYGAGAYSETFNLGSLSNWNTKNVTSMSNMFWCAGQYAKSVYIGDISNWDVSNLTNMHSMFSRFGQHSDNVNIGNISKWDTSNVVDMAYAFIGCDVSPTLNLSNWNVDSVIFHAQFADMTHIIKPQFKVQNLYNNIGVYFINGMTWADYVNGVFNCDLPAIENTNNVISKDGKILYYKDTSQPVNPNDLLSETHNYVWK